MTVVELICRVAAAAFTDRAPLGVRLSPVSIGAEELPLLLAEARRVLPANTFVALAAPGAEGVEDARSCIADGERAAERATAWRNQLAPAERILYVSARRLGRAGGLEDTLHHLTERELRKELVTWASDAGRVPEAVLAGLDRADIVSQSDLRSLCQFLDTAAGATMAEIGAALPILHLAPDSGLADNPEARIGANKRLVKRAMTRDNRGNAALVPKAVEVRRELEAALGGGAGGESLVDIDLGVLGTSEIDPAKVPRPRAAPPAPRPPRGGAASPPPKPSTSGAAATPPPTGGDSPQSLLGGGVRPRGEPGRAQIRGRAKATSSAWDLLPPGLANMVNAVLGGEGEGLVWATGAAPHALIAALPSSLAKPRSADLDPLRPLPQFAVWVSARAELVAALGEDLETLSSAPFVALSSADRWAIAARLGGAALALLEAAGAAGSDALRCALDLDTAQIAVRGETRLIALTPLHSVVLTQLLQRRRLVCAHASPTESRIALAGLRAPLAVPASWPTPTGPLSCGPGPRFAPLFGAPPSLAGVESVLAFVLDGLTRLLPHARLGVTASAEEHPAAVLRGLTTAMAATPAVSAAVLHARSALSLDDRATALVDEGRLRLEPLEPGVRAHLYVPKVARTLAAAIAPTELLGRSLPGAWSLADDGVADLVGVPVPQDAAAWTLVLGATRGAPPRPQFVLSRGAVAGLLYTVVCGDPRAAARALTPAYKALGVEKLTPRTIENLTRDLSFGAGGMISLGADPASALGAMLAELSLSIHLGEDAVHAGVANGRGDPIFGDASAPVALAAAMEHGGVRIALAAASLAPLGERERTAVAAGMEVVSLANGDTPLAGAARVLFAEALQSGWRRHADGPRVIEAILLGASLRAEPLLLGPSGSPSTMMIVGGQLARVITINAGMLEALTSRVRAG